MCKGENCALFTAFHFKSHSTAEPDSFQFIMRKIIIIIIIIIIIMSNEDIHCGCLFTIESLEDYCLLSIWVGSTAGTRNTLTTDVVFFLTVYLPLSSPPFPPTVHSLAASIPCCLMYAFDRVSYFVDAQLQRVFAHALVEFQLF